MAEDNESGEKTEEATPQRREEFRKQGQVAMTREAGSALLLFGFAAMLWGFGNFAAQHTVKLVKAFLGQFPADFAKADQLAPLFKFASTEGLLIVGPFLLITAILAFAATTLQVGFLTNSEVISPDFNKLNPVEGLKRIASLRSVVEGLKALIKVSLVGVIAFLLIKSELAMVPKLSQLSAEQLASYLGAITIKLFFGIGLFMAALAILDYGYQWWNLEKRMMMTKQELKEEIKSREGNPQIKARIRKIQRDLAQKRMMEAVPKADVIITNPTHIAIALKYDANLPAPQVIAKGADLIAEKIKELARQHGIPIVENKPLARTIFKTLKIGQVIPRELFQAVAEVLAYIYRLKKKAVN